MSKDKNTKKNTFLVRVYDEDVLTSIYELVSTNAFDSMNDLLNRALERGVNEIYKAYGKARALKPVVVEQARADIKQLEKRLASIALTVDDVFVLLSTIEMLTATSFNVQMAHIKGETVSDALVEQGYLSDVPKFIQQVRDNIIANMEQRKGGRL